MEYILKGNFKGRVNAMLKSGDDYVITNMSIAGAQHIIENGTVAEVDMDGYSISVDGVWFFPAEKRSRGKKNG